MLILNDSAFNIHDSTIALRMEYLITVDIGTTSTKLVAFNINGEILNHKNFSYPTFSPQPGYSEQDPAEILQSLKKALSALIIEMRDASDLLGISFSSYVHSVIAVDEQGNPLTNCMIWSDNRSKDEAESLKNSQAGLQIYLRTGTPIHPMSPLCKIAWIKNSLPDVFHRTFKFISIKEFIFYKFFGEFVVDHLMASSTGLFDLYTFSWNQQALEFLGISEKKLSRPVPVTFTIKNLLPEIKDELGLKETIPFIIGAGDGCLANLGSNSIKPGHAAVTIGTSGAIRVASNSSRPDNKQRVFNYLLDEETFIVGGAINNGAIVIDWFKKNFINVINDSGKDNTAIFNEISGKITNIPPGSEGLIFLPYLLGERAPIWDADARGVFFGITINHTIIHFLRAMMEGVIFALYSVSRSIEELVGEISVINAGGGFAKSEEWLQMLADIFNKKVLVNNSLENSSLGAAVMGFKALGIFKSLDEVERLIHIEQEFIPNYEKHILYLKYFNIFESLYPEFKGSFKEMRSQ